MKTAWLLVFCYFYCFLLKRIPAPGGDIVELCIALPVKINDSYIGRIFFFYYIIVPFVSDDFTTSN